MIATAAERFDAGQFSGVVDLCNQALFDQPDCLPLLIFRARARIALRRDLDAQADLRDVIRIDPDCGLAYRLLGELAARRDENHPAAMLFREALRLDPFDHEATDWLVIVTGLLPPGAVAARPTGLASDARAPRFAHGTQASTEDDRPTQPFARGGDDPDAYPVELPTRRSPHRLIAGPIVRALATLPGHPLPLPPAKLAPRLSPTPRPTPRSPLPELPGFGEYLVTAGILSHERLRAAQAYQRSMKVQLATAIVTLGLATPQRLERAAVAHRSQIAGSPQ